MSTDTAERLLREIYEAGVSQNMLARIQGFLADHPPSRDFLRAVIAGRTPEDYGKDAATLRRLASMAEELLKRESAAPPDRADAVNLARNVLDGVLVDGWLVTPTGARCLASAVLRMDEWIKAKEGNDE